MTLETIIKLFHKAGASKLYYTDPVAAQRVAQMIADAENEACAKLCENLEISEGQGDCWDIGTLDCADAIRARKELK